MSREATELLQRALSLTEEERALLAGSLLDSLDATTNADVETAWQQEIARRLEDLDRGQAKTISWTEVRRHLSAKLPQR